MRHRLLQNAATPTGWLRQPLWRGLAALACTALAACVPPPQPTPAPAPAPAAAPAAAPARAPVPSPAPAPPFQGSWMDAPITPGDWSYQAGLARFGEPASEPRLTLRCDRASGTVEIARAGSAAAPIIVRAELAERSVAAAPAASVQPQVIARVPARDPLLDAMAFSKGRFAVEVAGLPTLYVPSYPEVTRVIEDCR
jgi:hypothetical protein